MRSSGQLPFPALVGLETAQQALILLAIEPQLRGVVLAAPAGAGKSSLVRGIQHVLDDDTVPFVELPPSVDAENLLGGLDLEATLQRGEIVMQHGVLSRAHGGMVYVDGINLLTDSTANVLLSVLDSGEVHIEREGISQQQPANFSLIGSYDPAEGMPRQHLLDRIGLMVTLPGSLSASQRAEVLHHNLLRDPASWDDDVNFVRGMIFTAQEQLPYVTIHDDQTEQLCRLARRYGVQGHRAELFAARAACAAAAAELRETVNNDDLELAAKLVILPRATQMPQPEPEPDEAPPPPSQQNQDQTPENPPPQDQTPDAPPPDSPDSDESPSDSDDTDADDDSTNTSQSIAPPEQVLEALDAQLPDELDDLPYLNLRKGKSGSRGATEGNRGRHIRSVPGSPSQGRIDIIATLRAAAPWQGLREANSDQSHRSVYLDASDVRIKKYRSKAGALFCFGVDASGSMALHRMRQAKGAVHALLEKAYVNRDRVALMAFRGENAELLLPPTQSVELARRALDLLPTGGGTPLASALMLACDIAEQAKMRGIMQTMLILLTDGRANIPYKEDANAQEEIQQLSSYVRECGVHVVVVDTKRSYLSKGEARQLAQWLGGDYAYLPNAQGEDIADMVKNLQD